MRRFALAVLFVAAFAAAPRKASADEPTVPPPPSVAAPPQKVLWYGWETLLVDAVSMTLAASPAYLSGPLVDLPAAVGGAGLLFGGPTVHWGRGLTERGFVSLGIRVLLPTIGAIAGLASGACSPSTSGPSGPGPRAQLACIGVSAQGMGVGALAGAGVAAVVDASALTWKDVDGSEPPPPKSPPAASWSPGMLVVTDAGHARVPTFGIAGTF
jgi:hypothetical protein